MQSLTSVIPEQLPKLDSTKYYCMLIKLKPPTALNFSLRLYFELSTYKQGNRRLDVEGIKRHKTHDTTLMESYIFKGNYDSLYVFQRSSVSFFLVFIPTVLGPNRASHIAY